MSIKGVLAVVLALSTVWPAPVLGYEIKLLKKVELSQEKELLQTPEAFCVTDDGLIIIPDFKAGNIKIYDQNGSLVKVLGRKGYGPNEFKYPLNCTYDNNTKQFAVADFGLRKIFIYQRTGTHDFKRVSEIYSQALIFDYKSRGAKIYFSALKKSKDGEYFEFFIIDMNTNARQYLLPAYYKYGLNSAGDFYNQYFKNKSIRTLGAAGWFDISGNTAYYAWEGDLRIIKINLNSGQLNTFGHKTVNYIKPIASKVMLNAFTSGKDLELDLERSKLHLIRDIIATSEYLLVLYGAPGSEVKLKSWAHFYKLNGTFIKESIIPNKMGKFVYFDKTRSILYTIWNSTSPSNEEKYYLVVYNVKNKQVYSGIFIEVPGFPALYYIQFHPVHTISHHFLKHKNHLCQHQQADQ